MCPSEQCVGSVGLKHCLCSIRGALSVCIKIKCHSPRGSLCGWHYLKQPSILMVLWWAFYDGFTRNAEIFHNFLFSCRNTADTEGSWLLLSSADRAHLLKTRTSLESCIYLSWPHQPAGQFCPSRSAPGLGLAPRGAAVTREPPLPATAWSLHPDSCSVCSLHSP